MATERIYTVTFDTQSNRICRQYEFITVARNQKEAIAEAREKWYSIPGRKPHMFHLAAARTEDPPEDAKLGAFNVVTWRNANWLWQDTLDPRTPADKWRSCR